MPLRRYCVPIPAQPNLKVSTSPDTDPADSLQNSLQIMALRRPPRTRTHCAPLLLWPFHGSISARVAIYDALRQQFPPLYLYMMLFFPRINSASIIVASIIRPQRLAYRRYQMNRVARKSSSAFEGRLQDETNFTMRVGSAIASCTGSVVTFQTAGPAGQCIYCRPWQVRAGQWGHNVQSILQE